MIRHSALKFYRIANKQINFLPTRMKSTRETEFNKCVDLKKIREEFKQFEGGCVTFNKDEEQGIAYICLDNPDKKNGMTGKMMVELNNAIASLEEWSTGKGVILYGLGTMFCSGGNLETVKQICTPEAGYKMSTLMQDSVMRLRQLPLFSVCVIHGKAIGGGAELTLATDCRLMSESAGIAFVQARMGVGTGWGGGYFLTKLLGRPKALELLLTGRQLSAREAASLGLVDHVIDDPVGTDSEARLNYAVNWLTKIIEPHEPYVLHTLKRIVHCENLEEEKLEFAKTWGGPIQLKALAKNIKHTK